MSDSRKEVTVKDKDLQEVIHRLSNGQDIREVLSLVNARTINVRAISEAREINATFGNLNMPFGML
jgi:hypothetical protein